MNARFIGTSLQRATRNGTSAYELASWESRRKGTTDTHFSRTESASEVGLRPSFRRIKMN